MPKTLIRDKYETKNTPKPIDKILPKFDDNKFFALKSVVVKRRVHIYFKRLFDIIVSFCGIIILLPIFVIISLAVCIDSEGGVFFTQIRTGKDEKEFKIIKFRTMVKDAEHLGPKITVENDKRITRVGAFLRNTKLDEIPQLINVLKGDMGIVGPRPEVPEYIKFYTKAQKNILLLRPGMMDITYLKYRTEPEDLACSAEPEKMYVDYIMPLKLGYNLEYVETASVWHDIAIVFAAIRIVLLR